MQTQNHDLERTHDELQKVYEQVPPDYWDKSYRSNPIQWLYHVWRFKFIRKMLRGLPQGARILDVGCGSGFAVEKCTKGREDLEVYGLDVADSLIDYASKMRPKFNFILAQGETLPFPDKNFDAILYLDTIEHLVDPAASLREARRCLKDNGFIVILVVLENHPVFRIIWSLWLRLRGRVWHEAHLRIFTKKNLIDLVKETGFKLMELENLFGGMSVLLKVIKN